MLALSRRSARLAAVGALEALGEAAAGSAENLAGLLKDRDERVRAQATAALADRANRKLHRDLLIKALKSTDKHIRAGVAGALASCRSYDVVEPLIALLTNSFGGARDSADIALGMITKAGRFFSPDEKPAEVKAWWQKC